MYNDKTTKVEVTIPFPELVLRAKERHEDMYAGIDLVADKLERQIRKYKTKVNRKMRETGTKTIFTNDVPPKEEEKEKEIGSSVQNVLI